MRRILHIVGGMNRGGVETWLMHVLRNIDRSRYHMDFLVHTTEKCAYDGEIRALGSQIIPCLNPRNPLQYRRNLYNTLKIGAYDVVHSHVHHFSGWTLLTAKRAGVPIRIAHSHNDTSTNQLHASMPRRAYLMLMKLLIQRYATCKLAASEKAAVALYGDIWKADPSHRLLYYGIDLMLFASETDGNSIRSSIGIPEGSFVVGHVGRFVEQKNHTFLIDIFNEIARTDEAVWLLLIGDGPLRPEIERKIRSLGLGDRVILAGLRDDVPKVMLGAMDCFLFPSLYEGLGIVLIEAQAAGLPCVYSDVVPEEATIVPDLVSTLSLLQSAHEWAEAAMSYKEQRPGISQLEALQCVQNSQFSIERSVRDLMAIYDG